MRSRFAIACCALLLSACGSGDRPDSWHPYTSQGAYSAALSADGHYAITGSIRHGGSLWDTRRHERLYDWNHQPGDYTSIVASAFSPEARFAATASSQDLVLWNLDNGQPVWFWSAPAEILALELAPAGDFALLGLGNHQAVYFDIKNGGLRQTLQHPARVRSVALSADARLALTRRPDDYRARLWDLNSGELLHTLEFANSLDTVALSPNGERAFSAATLDQAHIWDTATGKILHTLSGNEPLQPRRISYLSARFSEDGQQLLTGTASGLVQLWSVGSGTELRRWRIHKRDPYGPTSTGVLAVSFGNDGHYYAIGSNGVFNILR